jgi:L-ascorbate metabolism protein UlaG (beta-lactamase superfamily)
MKFTQIRNATIIVELANKKFLIDPMLAEKDTYPGFEGTVNSHLKYPTVGLPFNLNDIQYVDAVIVTHTHNDHWDDVAENVVPKDKLIFVQDEQDAAEINKAGFINVQVLDERTIFEGIKLIKTNGQHGNDEAIAQIGHLLGEVCGVIFMYPGEKTTYVAGDTVWNGYVANSIKKYSPEIIILNSGDAQVIGLGSIIMGKDDVREVYNASSNATIIASHMEAVNHATLSRRELKEFLVEHEMIDRVLVPEDGESYTL